jgi:hypothetical protein
MVADHCYNNYCLTFNERVMLNRTSVSISATAIEPKCAELGLVSMRTRIRFWQVWDLCVLLEIV